MYYVVRIYEPALHQWLSCVWEDRAHALADAGEQLQRVPAEVDLVRVEAVDGPLPASALPGKRVSLPPLAVST